MVRTTVVLRVYTKKKKNIQAHNMLVELKRSDEYPQSNLYHIPYELTPGLLCVDNK